MGGTCLVSLEPRCLSAHPWSLQQPLMIVNLLTINRCPSIDGLAKENVVYTHEILFCNEEQ